MPLRPAFSYCSYCKPQSLFIQRALFHASRPSHADNKTHYETLNIPTNATTAEIKKKFYALSKAHHPDRNPNDPHASARFVEISEAYATLGSPQKRDRYDRDLRIHARSSSQAANPYTTGPAGGRPASGLSKRRTHFRGPPPSFYRQGGWGTQSAKRAAAANAAASAASAAPSEMDGERATGGGFGPAGQQMGRDNDVPHFNRAAHLWTHEQQELRRARAARRRREAGDEQGGGGGMFVNFAFVGGIITLTLVLPSLFLGAAARGNWEEGKRRTK